MGQSMNFNKNTVTDSTINIEQKIISAKKIPDPPKLFGNFPLTKTIVGRDQDVRDLLRLVEDHHKVVITGIGGIGKTTLASLCANRWVNDEHFKHAVLINVETDNSANNSFHALAEHLFKKTVYTDHMINEVYQHYNTLEGQTIFVFDNIETRDTDYSIDKYLPDENLTKIYVLGTSQYTELGGIFELHTLDKLSIVSSVDMVRKVLSSNKKPIDIGENETNLITDLAVKLDRHPLALEHAAAYIADCTLYDGISVLESVQEYIKTLSERLEEKPPFAHPTRYRTPVHTALEMNIAQAISECEDARKLLFYISYLDPTYINIEMFYRHPAFKRERIKAHIRELKKYSIILQDGRYITLHRLIQTVYRSLIEKENTQNNYMLDLLDVLFYFDDIWDFGDIRRHCSYLIQNLNIDKEAMSTSYITAFQSNDAIIERLTARLKLINCNMEDVKDWSALHCSVFAGHETFYKYFNASEHGSGDDRPERYVSDTWTVFHVAIIRSSHIYLFHNLNPTDLNSFLEVTGNQKYKTIIKGLTTLNLCVALNVHRDHCSELIKIGCDVNIRDDSGMTPILYAARNMDHKLVFTLHRAGATYDQSYKQLMSAASDDNHKLVLLLLRISDIGCAASDFSKTLLHWAVHEGYCDLVLELIERHTDINVADADGGTPLLVAARLGHNEVVAALLDRGANTEVHSNDGDTPLLVAARLGHSEIVAVLLDRGANTEVTDSISYTPLMWAVKRGFSEIVAALLDRGANTEVTNSVGNTPLLLAARWERSEIVTALLNRGVNIDAKNKRGETALSIAIRKGRSTIVELLNEHRARTGGEPS